MPRGLRIEYVGAFYHVMARGNRRQAIFRDDDDRDAFVRALGEICGRTGWRVHAWALMSNHYHLFIQTPEPNLVAGMKWLQNAYTRRFNARHGEWGRLFGDRYKAAPVDGKVAEYYVTLADYIHLNAVRAGLVKLARGEDLLDYPWSSLASGFALAPSKRPPWLAAGEGLAALGFSDNTSGRRKYVDRLKTRARETPARKAGVTPPPEDARQSHLRRGWYWGSQAFAEALKKRLGSYSRKSLNRTYRASPHRAHGEQEARRVLAQGLEDQKLDAKRLPNLLGNDPRKVAIAQQLWASTTVSQQWIAERLEMKSAANVSQILRRLKRELSGYGD